MPVKLQPMAFDLVPRSIRELPYQVTHGALVEIADAAAAGADEVVMVLRALR